MQGNQYSPQHVAAFLEWQAKGSLAISEETLARIANEDPEMGVFIQRERAQAREQQQTHLSTKAATDQRPTVRYVTLAQLHKAGEAIGNVIGKAQKALHAQISKEIDERIEDRLANFVFAKGAAVTLKSFIDAQITEREQQFLKRIDELQAKVAELEARPTPSWSGVWAPGKRYAAGNLVTKNGLWLALATTTEQPGNSPAWKLIVRETSR